VVELETSPVTSPLSCGAAAGAADGPPDGTYYLEAADADDSPLEAADADDSPDESSRESSPLEQAAAAAGRCCRCCRCWSQQWSLLPLESAAAAGRHCHCLEEDALEAAPVEALVIVVVGQVGV